MVKITVRHHNKNYSDKIDLMAGKNIGYIRVSTIEQNLERQLDGLKLDRSFVDKVSSKSVDRPALQEMLTYVRDGNTVIIHSMDRLARNVDDLRKIVNGLNAHINYYPALTCS